MDPAYQPDDAHALTMFGGTLTILSTIVGGGIVGLPYAFLELGVAVALVLVIVFSIITINTSWIYLKAKDLIPGKPESMYEMGYMLVGRSSIFALSVILVLNSLGLCMGYFIIFSNTLASFIKDAAGIDPKATGFKGFLIQKYLWIILLGLGMLPLILKKELQELHIVSLSLFFALLLFVFIVFLQVVTLGPDAFAEGEGLTMHQLWVPQADIDFWKVVKSICFLLVAFSFAINLFPIYSALKYKTNEYCNKTISVSVGLTAVIYTFLSVPCICLFGREIEVYKANILNNINHEYEVDTGRWESFILRFLFMVVLACHIPFIFFSGKEALLIIIDEIDRRSVSATLDARVEDL